MTSPTDSAVGSDSENSSRPISRRELRRQWQREQALVEGTPKSIFDLEAAENARTLESEVTDTRPESLPTSSAQSGATIPTIIFQRIPEEEPQTESEQDSASPAVDVEAKSSRRRNPAATLLSIAAVVGVTLTLALPAIDVVNTDDASADSGQVLLTGDADGTQIDPESFESVDELQAAAEAALTRADTFVNDSTAPVQYPFPFGVPLTDGFGPRSFPVSGFHDAQDFGAGYGGAVQSIADGTVIESGTTSDGCGFGLKIRHRIDGQNVESRYCHLATAPVVQVGERVRVGQFVALVGSTGLSYGAHLHFVVEVNGKAVDPMPFLAKYNRPRSEW